MNKVLTQRLGAFASVVAIVGAVVSPAIVSAATTANTTINANVATTVAVSTTGATVGLAISPATGGAQTSSSDTVTIATNDTAGYTLKLGDTDSNATLVNGGNNIGVHAGTYAAPTALANNTWGYAVPGLNNFDASYSALASAPTSTSKWAGMPVSGSEQTIKTTAATASNDTVTVWYAAKVDFSKPVGTYADQVTYTGVAN